MSADGGAPFTPAPGTLLGPFLLQRPLGEGAMGVVWLAEDTDLGRPVALKLLRPSLRENDEAAARFETEARAAARLRHESIVVVHGAGRSAGVPWIAMEYVAGVSLAAVLAELRLAPGVRPGAADLGDALRAARLRARLDRTAGPGPAAERAATDGGEGLRRMVRWVREAATGVAHAHLHGVLHRDIKPANLLLDGDGRVRVVDFGVARLEDAVTLTRTGAVVGTLGYMAPEALDGDRLAVDGRADVYSLGVVLFQAISRRLPFEEASLGSLVRAVAAGGPPRLKALAPWCPPEIEAVVARCLAHDRADRYATAGDLAEDLLRWERGEPVRARPLAAHRRARVWVRRHPRAAAMVVGVVAVCAAVAAAEVSARTRQRQSGLEAAARARARFEAPLAERERILDRARDLLDAMDRLHPEREHRDSTGDFRTEAALAKATVELEALAVAEAVALAEAEAAVEEAGRVEAAVRGSPSEETRSAAIRLLLLRFDRARLLADAPGQQAVADRLAALDPSGIARAALDRPATLRIGDVPEGVALHLFRYVDVTSTPGNQDAPPRLVPLPCDPGGAVDPGPGPWPNVRWGAEASEITSVLPGTTAALAGLSAGDVVLQAMGTGSGRVVRIRAVAAGGGADAVGLQRWDAIHRVGAVRMDSVVDWRRAATRASGVPLRVDVSTRAPFVVAPGSTPAEALGVEVAECWSLLSEPPPAGGAELLVARSGGVAVLRLPAGVATGLTALPTSYPLIRGPRNRIPSGARLSIPPGSYLVLATGDACESVRQPVLLHAGEDVALRWRLHPPGATPAGFVRIPEGAYFSPESTEDPPRPLEILARGRHRVNIGEFVIARTEVTTAEWYEFLNDPETRRRCLADARFAGTVLPRTADGLTPLWHVDAEGRVLPTDDPAVPVRGVSREGIHAFLDWRNARMAAAGSRWRVRLPRPEEWRRAATGGDGRPYPWGHRYVLGFAVAHDSFVGAIVESVAGGSAPFDESPFGVMDLAGSRREWAGSNWILGSSWGDSGWRPAHAGFAESWSPSTAHGTLGFRLVLDPAP